MLVKVLDEEGLTCVNCRMTEINTFETFTVPVGNQEIQLQDLLHDAGGMHLMRVRIRERSRFTVFDVDPVTARHWAQAMLHWADAQDAGAPGTDQDDGVAGD